MLTARGLSFGYSPDRPVLRGVGLGLTPGRLTVLVGPNGSGKSTLLRLLAGLRPPDAGEITLDGKPVSRWSPAERAARLAYLAQRPDVAFGFSARDVVRFGLVAARDDRASAIADDALRRVGIADRAETPFAHLSVGQQQRVGLARAAAQLAAAPGPAALLADEPVSAMDPRHAIGSMRLMRALVAGDPPRAALVVLHDLSLAARFADDALLLDERGRVAACGPAGEVLTPGRLAPVFRVGFTRLDTPTPALLPTDPLPETGTDPGPGSDPDPNA